jgi:hypothetical protein
MAAAAVTAQAVVPARKELSFSKVAQDYAKTSDGLKAMSKTVSYASGWASVTSSFTGFVPSTEFLAAGKTAGTTKNALEALSLPGSVWSLICKVSDYFSGAASVTGKEIVQSVLGLSAPLYDTSELIHKNISPLSAAASEFLGKVNFTVLTIFMSWKAKDEIDMIQVNQAEVAKPETSEEKKKTLAQWINMGMANTAKCVSYLALGALKMLELFFAVAVPGWGYLACITVGLVTGVGAHFYGRMNGLEDKNPAIALQKAADLAAAAG